MNRFFTLITFQLCVVNLLAQYFVDSKKLNELESGTTYIIMNDTASVTSKSYQDIYKKYWTASKIKFITPNQIEKYAAPNSYYLKLRVFGASFQNGVGNGPGGAATGVRQTSTHVQLYMWKIDEDYFKRKKKEGILYEDQLYVAWVDLFPEYKFTTDPSLSATLDYDFGGHIRSWGPGILKNWLLFMMPYLKEKKNLSEKLNTVNEEKLKKLKTQPLYVTDYVLIKFGAFSGDESERIDEKELFKNYPFPYKLISPKELNEKILKDQESFYYLLYIRDSAHKYINIVDSKTGEIIYSDDVSNSYNMKPGDLKDISKLIAK